MIKHGIGSNLKKQKNPMEIVMFELIYCCCCVVGRRLLYSPQNIDRREKLCLLQMRFFSLSLSLARARSLAYFSYGKFFPSYYLANKQRVGSERLPVARLLIAKIFFSYSLFFSSANKLDNSSHSSSTSSVGVTAADELSSRP